MAEYKLNLTGDVIQRKLNAMPYTDANGNVHPIDPQYVEGAIPEKGVDYWTEADQESIVQQVIAALGTPVFGTVDENNNIILSGELASGTYTVKYEDAEGNTTDIGSLTAVAGSFEAPITWNNGYSIRTNIADGNVGELQTQDSYAASDLISFENGYAYTVYADNWPSGVSCYAMWFNANGGLIASGSISSGDGWSTSASGSVSFVLNPPEGAAMFRLQSYCGSNHDILSAVTVEANVDSTKQYGGILITWQNGVKLSKTDGSVESTGQATYSASDFIQLDSTKTYTLNLVVDVTTVNSNTGIIYYDASGNYVSTVADVVGKTAGVTSYTLVPPTNAAQIRIRAYDGSYSYAFVKQHYIAVT